jgi:hypothetical protein
MQLPIGIACLCICCQEVCGQLNGLASLKGREATVGAACTAEGITQRALHSKKQQPHRKHQHTATLCLSLLDASPHCSRAGSSDDYFYCSAIEHDCDAVEVLG